jgi:hypothetical protein
LVLRAVRIAAQLAMIEEKNDTQVASIVVKYVQVYFEAVFTEAFGC